MYHPEKARHSKLKPYVAEIRARHKQGYGYRRLAKMYGVHYKSIENVINYVSYPYG